MKKILLFVLLSCFVLPTFSEGVTEDNTGKNNPKFEEVCQTGNVDYVVNLGFGDYISVRYHQVFARFIASPKNGLGFWFYVYKQGELPKGNIVNGIDLTNLPPYVAVRVYNGNQEAEIYAKYDTYDPGIFVINTAGSFSPFYFTSNGQNHLVMNYLPPDTVVLSATLDGESLTNFETEDFHKVSCGEEKPEFR